MISEINAKFHYVALSSLNFSLEFQYVVLSHEGDHDSIAHNL